MSIDQSLELRKAIVTNLRADPDVAALVGDRVYGEEPPPDLTWPFVRYGLPITDPFEATRWSGSEHDVTIHTFAKGPGTDVVDRLNAVIVAALDDSEMAYFTLSLIAIDWTGTQVLRDTDEAGAYHGMVRFTVQTAVQSAA